MVAAWKWAQQGKTTTAAKCSKHDFQKNEIDEEEISLSDKENSNKNKDDEDNDESNNENEEENKNKEEANLEAIQKFKEMVSDKNNVTGAIVDMFLDDAPATQLPGTVEAAVKNVVNTVLFWGG